MMTDETTPEEFGRKKDPDHSHIKGWGIDADTRNDPTYPIKKRTDEEHEGYSWPRPPQQPVTQEILRSVERPNLTATFGTSAPPHGLSGRIRRMAFKYSESSYGRWLPLILADRVDAVEGIISDIARGHIPNVFAERGWNAEWKYNRKAFVTRLAVKTLVVAGVVTFFILSRKAKKDKHKHIAFTE